MEKLTNRCKIGLCGSNNKVTLFPLFKIGSNNMYSDKGLIQECFEKLAHYEDLEEQGLLIKIPCKVGDTIYLVDLENGYDESQVNEIIIDERGTFINSDYGDNIPVNAPYIAYTKEDAERKIKEHNDTNECLFEKEKRNDSRR